MHRLIEKGLMFGNLIRVDSSVLVERYNRALKHLTGHETDLDVFHVDISGYSPEVGDELGDDLYLNHKGVNRQFILLTTEQVKAPLLNAKFSTSRGIIRQFIVENRAELFALTARDAVAGELINSVYNAPTPARLFDIRQISVEADTTGGTVATAAKLGGLIDQFKTEPDAWYDDVLIAQMIGMAKETGDVSRNPVNLRKMTFAQENFWTNLFGDMYVFRDVAHPAAIVGPDMPKDLDLPIPYTFRLKNRAAIAKFLSLNDLVAPISEGSRKVVGRIIHQKMDMMLASVAVEHGEDVMQASPPQMRRLVRKYVDDLPKAWHGLAALLRWVDGDGPWPKITSDDPAYFYMLRAKPHVDADLVNRLLAELTPLDVRQLFICHKDAFYSAYAGWSEPMKDYVARFLERDYQRDKSGTREMLFHHEHDPLPLTAQDHLIDRVGPWGTAMRRL